MSPIPGAALALLASLLPFEPMTPVIRGTLMELSFLELAAAGLLGLAGVSLLRDLPNRIPLGTPAALFVVIGFASTLQAAEPRLLPLKASLRVLAGVMAFLVTSAALKERSRFASLFAGLAASGAVVAAAAVLERALWPEPLAILDAFREQSFEVAGEPRVSSTFAYPNLLAGFLAATLPAVLFFRRGHPRATALTSLMMFLAVLLTYSRGALLGAVAATSVVWLGNRRDPFFLRLHVAFAVTVGIVLVALPTFRLRATSEGDRGWYEARIVPEHGSIALTPGELITTSVTIENAGRLTWANDGEKPIHLSYRWFERTGEDSVRPVPIEGERTRLDRPLAPGESRSIRSTVRAPEREGRYLLVWDMVHEHTTWFSDKMGLATPVVVTVRTERRPEASPPGKTGGDWSRVTRAWHPGRLELWSAALRLFATRPLLGVGPDNFRWQYGPVAGHRRWDTRTYANSLYLETLATTGLVGTLALALVVGGAVVGLARVPRDAITVTLLASIAGFLVHGIFDYLLEATPMYLTFWMLLGAASARIRLGATP